MDDEIKFDDWNYEELKAMFDDWNYEELKAMFDDVNLDDIEFDIDMEELNNMWADVELPTEDEIKAETEKLIAELQEAYADLPNDEIFKGFDEVVNSEREKFDMSLEANIFGNDTTANKGKAGRRRRRKSK